MFKIEILAESHELKKTPVEWVIFILEHGGSLSDYSSVPVQGGLM